MLDSIDRPAQSRLPQDARREQLIQGAIQAIAEHGLSNLTSSKVAEPAGLTAGMVNFHFESKQELLKATLEWIAQEYRGACEAAIAGTGADPARALGALIDASFTQQLSSPEKLAVWYAFWGETQARNDYMAICGASDRAFYETVHASIAALTQRAGARVDARAAALGLCGLIDALWQEILVEPAGFDREAAAETCRRYLDNLIPGSFGSRAASKRVSAARTDGSSLPQSLPGWAYCDDAVFRQEVQRIHLPAWHPVCHVSELRGAGDYVAFDALGERAFAIRSSDGAIRAFHNVCRHRGHAVVGGQSGTCKGVIACPYHAWSYDLTGALRGVAAEKTLPGLDKAAFGLHSLECETMFGFVYIRFRSGGASLAERFATHAEELGHYRFAEMEPISESWAGDVEADWKNVWDNYLEDYHFPTGHPGLAGLMSPSYDRQPEAATRTVRLSHVLRDQPKGGGSARMYAKVLPECEHLPPALRRRWSYYFLYPSMAFDVYPDMMDFFHIVPLGPGRSRLRWRAYGLPGASREMLAARRLNMRINRQVHDEDAALIESVQKGLASSSYSPGVLSRKEVNVAALHEWIRADLPGAGI